MTTGVFILLIHYYQQCSFVHCLMEDTYKTWATIINFGATVTQHSDMACQLIVAHALTQCDTDSFLEGI